jgi:hypothetical protein
MTTVPGAPEVGLAPSSDSVGGVCALTGFVDAVTATTPPTTTNIARPAPLRIRAV